jgi:xyloglucan-specific exo-beta-1,4-glucanase
MKYVKTLLVLATALAAASASAQNAAGYKWDVVPFGGAGMVTGVYPSKTESGVVYARTDVGGAYRWDKNNAKWVALMDWVPETEAGMMGVDSMAVDPKNAANIVLLTGINYFNEGKTVILRSTNYGQSFTSTDVTAQAKVAGKGQGRHSDRLSFDPGSSNILYLGSRANGLLKSTDSGASWTRMNGLNVTTTPNQNGVNMVLPDPGSVTGGVAQRLIVGVSRPSTVGPNLYRSNDGGQTFTAISGPPGHLMPQHGAFDGQGNLYITYANGAGPGAMEAPLNVSDAMDQGGVWKYNVGTGSWSNVTPAGWTRAFSGISIDPGNPQRIITSTMYVWVQQWNNQANGNINGGDRVFLTTNGGASWTDVVANSVKATGGIDWILESSMHGVGTVVFDPFNTQTAWGVSGNGIFKTTNVSASQPTWTFDVKGLEESVPLGVVSMPGGPLVTAIGDYDGFRNSNTSTYGTRFTPTMGSTFGLAMAPGNPNIMARVGNKLQVSWNGSVNWYQAAVTNGANGKVALSANGGVLLHSPDNSSTTYRSDNFGASWTSANNLNIKNAHPVADAYHTNLLYAYDPDNGNFWTSYDGGINFWVASVPGNHGVKRLGVPPGIGGEVWLPMNYKGLMRSTNSGSSFTKINSVTDCSAIGFGKAAPGSNYPTIFIWGTVGGVRGLFRSTDVGNTWLRVNDDAHQYGTKGEVVTGDMNTFGVVYMGTGGRGLAVGRQ